MTRAGTQAPDVLPVLARGKHRRPRKGACFMELASYLAGERWSDHPACTAALLATVARHVNDYTSDEARPRLAGLIPSVIGLTADDPAVDARVALHCARRAFPVVAAERQRAMAVAVLTCERVLTKLGAGAPGGLSEESRSVLAQVPQTTRWAEHFAQGSDVSVKTFRRNAGPSIVHLATQGIARACISDPDAVLREVLVTAIAEYAAAQPDRESTPAVSTAEWERVCQLTGVATTS